MKILTIQGPRSGAVNIWLIAGAAVAIATIISWVMVTNLAASKTDYASEVNQINNNIGHVKDSTTSLDNFTSYQNTRIDTLTDNTQTQFEQVNGTLTDVNTKVNGRIDDSNNKISQTQNDLAGTKSDLAGVKTQANNLKTQTDGLATQSTQLSGQLTTVSQKADTTKSSLDSLTTKVASLASGLQITPSVSSGTISLAINSDAVQTVAFKLEFRSTTDMPQLATMDASLAALYGTPPVTLTAGTEVRGDYTLFWDTTDSLYHLGEISFITMGTSLAAGANSRSITYVTSSDTYEILISPVFPTGASSGSW